MCGTTLKILKFGGSSVGTPRSFANAVTLAADTSSATLIVVSALSGVTDLLTRLSAGETQLLEPIRNRHHEHAAAVLDPVHAPLYLEQFETDFGQLERLIQHIRTKKRPSRADADAVLGFGERFSSRLFAVALRARSNRARFCDAQNFVRTSGRFGGASPDGEATTPLLRRRLVPLLDQGCIVVTQGFVGVGPDGRATTLGRGGSDLTATFLGALLPAAEIQIWTDVDGIYDADPRTHPNARRIPELSLEEAYQLARNGAKVLYPPCLKPLRGRAIPLHIRNTFQPEAAGARILPAASL